MMHNAGLPGPKDGQSFYEVEMTLDRECDEDLEQEIIAAEEGGEGGRFVSFRYLREFGTGGPPLNPKVS